MADAMGCSGRAMKRPLNWPRYMKARRLADGLIGYYWVPHERDVAAGFTLAGEPLGKSYGDAIERARVLNAHLDSWREGQSDQKRLDDDAQFGSLTWLFERYRRSAAFERVSERSRPEYLRALERLEDLPTRDGRRVGELLASTISPRAADKIYEAVQLGPKGKRVRQANLSIDIARRAWDVVHRLYPKEVAHENPFRGVLRVYVKKAKSAATRAEAYALAGALKEIGEPHLGAAALICFEWLQRPENVLAGSITWADYRGPGHPRHARIFHHKTGAEVLQPLDDDGRLLYPEIEAYLGSLPRLASAIVVTNGTRGASRLYSVFYARKRVREARKLVGLGEHVTLDACRHGGMTELGDAELAEQSIMALSGHKTPSAARPYIKKTERQRVRAAAKRRAWVEQCQVIAKVEMRGGSESGNAPGKPGQRTDIIGTASWARTTDPQIHNLVL
jgi:integrase